MTPCAALALARDRSTLSRSAPFTRLEHSDRGAALLRSIEDLFALDHLGYAADPALPAFDRVVYNASSPRSG
jgi:hypothetical protein